MDVLEDEVPVGGVAQDIGGVAADQLRSIVERIERLEEEKANIANDIKEVYSEAKGNGFDAKIIRKVVALRKKDKHDLAEEEELLALYRAAVGV
ncbi:DUF2312 domain-containing protein [Rhodospirillum rubrum]|uniref:UPF0335 protein Rru_A1042 n=1 Tax=Rhodospirillum rubrum (strain ATCC 11170 / ATH 1.1.1 / DSM 467 / LMG 4362 / NCIMB 8255 / S1) TaxID=269796 RepID=Q2RVK2_RHORT|nr:DUF2312 domain-containing protein [Rhodospirillum rubrum]ABC21843.1 conserved hypothetical protein [Rhodospirillum rubrum ATCC 11170]AEO47543.1 hypothetical protein F11_05365 [Rhodospirillum rubrum F11]MBK5953405.1 DUF2312 domain-containing protein [Rhodospirillum rubrum]QXG81504.1 DUF2312 domain-containing protein [Rhodospirillum rubrum]HAQ01290.1 DUF2312 domain-containing protein [Rhodospirillum rubrum]